MVVEEREVWIEKEIAQKLIDNPKNVDRPIYSPHGVCGYDNRNHIEKISCRGKTREKKRSEENSRARETAMYKQTGCRRKIETSSAPALLWWGVGEEDENIRIQLLQRLPILDLDESTRAQHGRYCALIKRG